MNWPSKSEWYIADFQIGQWTIEKCISICGRWCKSMSMSNVERLISIPNLVPNPCRGDNTNLFLYLYIHVQGKMMTWVCDRMGDVQRFKNARR